MDGAAFGSQAGLAYRSTLRLAFTPTASAARLRLRFGDLKGFASQALPTQGAHEALPVPVLIAI